MKIDDALSGIGSIYLDSSPVIYYAENNPQYYPIASAIFSRIENGDISAVTSTITLAECLVVPIRLGLASRQQVFLDLLVHGPNLHFVALGTREARIAADLRARSTCVYRTLCKQPQR